MNTAGFPVNSRSETTVDSRHVLSPRAFTSSPCQAAHPGSSSPSSTLPIFSSSREEMLRSSPASSKHHLLSLSQQTPGVERSTTALGRHCQFSPPKIGTGTEQNTLQRSATYPDPPPQIFRTETFPQPEGKPETQRLTCITGWGPPLCTGNLSQSLPPQRHRRVHLHSHQALLEKEEQPLNDRCTAWQRFM